MTGRSEWDVHPLVTIFTSRNAFMNSKNTEPEEKLMLSKIPFVDKPKINEAISLFRKHHSLKQVIKAINITPKFEKKEIEELRNAILGTMSSDILIVSACFSCLKWFLDETQRRMSSEFRDLCSILTHFAGIDAKWCCVTNYSFQKLLKGALSPENGIDWNIEAFRAVFAHFFIASNLKPDIFKYFMRFCQLCIESEIPEVTVELHTFVYSLISEKRACLDWRNVGELIFLFAGNLNGLDRRCVMLLAKLSTISESQAIFDSIMLLPPSLLNQASGVDAFIKENAREEEMDLEMSTVVFSDLPMEFEAVDRFENGVALLPDEDLEVSDPVCFMTPKFCESIDTITSFVRSTSVGGRQAFLEAYSGLLSVLSGTKKHLEMCYAFIMIWTENKDLLDVEFIVKILIKCGLFDYRENIYKTEVLHPVVNYLRNLVFANLEVHSVQPLLGEFSGHPFMLTECLARMIRNWPGLRHCAEEGILQLAVQAAHQMRLFAAKHEDTDYIWRARSHNFTFLFRVCSSWKLLASPIFSDGFLWFVFDKFLRSAVLITFKENLAKFEHGEVGPTCNYLSRILKMCAVNTNEEKNELAEAVALSIRNGLVINPVMINQFEAAFTDLFELLSIYRSKNLLCYCLSIWELYTQVKIEKITKAKHMKLFADCIEAIYQGEISREIDKHLCNLMSCCSSLTDFEHFHIKKPSVIPLVLFCYGRSSTCVEFIRRFHRLCRFSRFNIRSCVDGGMDTIFLDFIFQKKEEAVVSYRGLDIVIKLKFSEVQDVLMPFLKTLFYFKSSNAVANRFAQQLVFGVDDSTVHIYEELSDIIAYSISMPGPRFEIGTMPSPFTIRGFKKQEFASCFTVTFLASFDFPSLFASNSTVFICSISDNASQTLRFYVNHMSLFVRVDFGDQSRVKQLVRCLPQTLWTRFRIMCERLDNGMLEIRTVCGFERKNSVSIQFDKFVGDDIEVEVGGYEHFESGWINTELILLSEFAIYPVKWDRKEKRNPRIKPLFTTNRGFRYERYRRKGDNAKWVTSRVNSDYTHNLLFFLLKGLFSNSVSQYFRVLHPTTSPEHPKMIVALLDQIFSLSKGAQARFMGVDAIANHLVTNPRLADQSMFHCFLSIFGVITYEPLINEWFSKLIVNTWLWCRGSRDDFQRVLYYLGKVLVFQYQDCFRRNSCVSRLINQFFLMFHMPEKIRDTHRDIQIGEGELSTFCSANRALFETFIERAFYIQFTKEDADLLFYHMLNATSDHTTLTILRMMVDVSSSVLLVSDNLSNNLAAVEKLLSSTNIDILELAILVTHKLSGRSVYLHMLAISYQLMDCQEQAALFDRLIARLPTYPNLHALISILALRIGGDYVDLAASGLRALCSIRSYLKDLDYSEYWFIWDLLLALNSSDRARADVCLFLATASSLGPQPVLDIDIMLALYEFIRSFSDCSCDFTFDLINAYASLVYQSQEILRHCISSLFYSTFFHCNGALHDDALVACYNSSPFCSLPYEHPVQRKLGFPVNCPLRLELLLSKDVKDLPVRYGMRIRADGEWIDAKRSTLALSLCSQLQSMDPKIELLQNVLRYMTDTKSIPVEGRAQLRAHMDIMFEQLRFKYSKTLHEDLERAKKYLNDFMMSSKTLVGKVLSVSLDEYRKASIHALNEELKFGGVIEDTAEIFKSVYTRSRIISAPGCPFSMKRTRRHRKRHVVAVKPVFEGKCVRVKIDQNKEYVCRFDHKRIVLAESKFIRLNHISMLLTRKRNNKETAIEILTIDGRSALLDFAPLEASHIVRTLCDLPMPYATVIQRTSSAELLMSLGYTKRWVAGLMTNFEYILKLNLISGRSFSDRTLYPFFPSILSNYHDRNQIRDFSILRFHEPALESTKTLQELLESEFLIIPEYYYTSCVIDDGEPLPMWASTKYELVHKLRKLLEAQIISELLPAWIDKLFGVKKLGGLHRQIFTSLHPKRRISLAPNVSIQHIRIRNIEIDRCFCLESEKGEFNFVFRLKSGTIMTLKTNITNFMDAKPVVNFKTPPMGRYTLSAYEDTVVIAGRDNQALLVMTGDKVVSYPYIAETDFVFCGLDCVIFCPDSTTIATKGFGGQAKVLWRLNSGIFVMEASWKFKVFAFAGADNVVRVGSCRTGKEINHCDIGCEVLKILITPNMGYILLLTFDAIVVLNIDGEFVKTQPFRERLRNWFVFSDAAGVDYVVIETENYQIGYFEAFYPETIEFFYETQSEVKVIAFDWWSEAFMIVRRNGKMTLVPHRLVKK